MVFAKAPVSGAVKTRLIPALGADGAAAFHARLLQHTLAMLQHIDHVDVLLYGLPDPQQTMLAETATCFGVTLKLQRGEDLGARMAAAFADNLPDYERVIVVGTDCPALRAAHYRQAMHALDTHDAVLIPAYDGGYVLLGLRRAVPDIFRAIDWSTDKVLHQTRERLKSLGVRWQELPALHDIDRPEDLVHCPSELLTGATHELAG